MIRSFRHKGLRDLFEKGERRKLKQDHVAKIERVLARLDEAVDVADMDLPGFRLHQLKGDLRDSWAVSISGNWRITFRFEDGDAYDVDYLDYH